jgi:hypothetical protein
MSDSTTMLQWGRCLSTAEREFFLALRDMKRPRFNGAAVFQQRKARDPRRIRAERRAASMGPLSFNSGKPVSAPVET